MKSILVVDDDPDTCQLLSTLLHKNNFYVETAFNGCEGLQIAKNSKPDLVVLDIMMPEMDGWETCRRMKAISDIPVLFLSARTDVASIAQGFKEGGDDYICKPFLATELTIRIERLLRNGTHPSPDIALPFVPANTYLSNLISFQTPQDLYRILKRLMDIVVSGIALILLAPLILVIAALIKFDSDGPIIFKQERIRPKSNQKGSVKSEVLSTFQFLKFRTMHHGASSEPHRTYLEAFIKNDKNYSGKIERSNNGLCKLTEDSRVTRLGKLLRKSSLDEIPQFWNVLKGDMSLVGPRPPIPYEVDMYKAWHRKRLQVKPGLTGLWQVTARSSADFDEMVRMDIWYIEHQSLWLDLRIILKTPLSVLSMEGAI